MPLPIISFCELFPNQTIEPRENLNLVDGFYIVPIGHFRTLNYAQIKDGRLITYETHITIDKTEIVTLHFEYDLRSKL